MGKMGGACRCLHRIPGGTAAMQHDNEVCLCFHVPMHKITSFLRLRRPRCASQLSECNGAGTGCGWCRPFLKQMFDAAKVNQAAQPAIPSAEEYAGMRARFLLQAKGPAKESSSSDGEPPAAN
jgi:bacterioferritin-associated ferredoxin